MFHGRYHKGYMREVKARKRQEAEARNARYAPQKAEERNEKAKAERKRRRIRKGKSNG